MTLISNINKKNNQNLINYLEKKLFLQKIDSS